MQVRACDAYPQPTSCLSFHHHLSYSQMLHKVYYENMVGWKMEDAWEPPPSAEPLRVPHPNLFH